MPTVYNYVLQKKSKENLDRTISIQEENDRTLICYQTSSQVEFNKLKEQITNEGKQLLPFIIIDHK